MSQDLPHDEEDHPDGYTQPEAEAILVRHGLDPAKFWEWMDGQTMGLSTSDECIVYRHDLWRYVQSSGKAPILD